MKDYLLLSIVLVFCIQTTSTELQCGVAYPELFLRRSARFNESAVQPTAKRIVGGFESRIGEWPWMVSLMFYQTKDEWAENGVYFASPNDYFSHTIEHTDGAKTIHMCGGTLIHPKWVLSAAHCFDGGLAREEVARNPKRWIARVGEHDTRNNLPRHYDLKIERIILHEDYDGYSYSNDIALLELSNPFPLTERINVACLPNYEQTVSAGRRCSTIGWGFEHPEAKVAPNVLRHVKVRIVSNEECRRKYAKYDSLMDEYIITKSMICAGHPRGGKDACQLDSGGPMVCKWGGQWYLTGVVAFGEGCGSKDFPGVYTRVSSFIPWIKEHVHQH